MWNQDTQYFARDVAHTLFPMKFKRWNEKCQSWIDWCTERMRRFGGKHIDAVIDGLRRPSPRRRARRAGRGSDMKKLWIQPQGNGQYLVGSGKVRKNVFAAGKPEALKKAKETLTQFERSYIRETSTRSERAQG